MKNRRSIFELSKYVVDQVRAFGMTVNGGSRIDRMVRAVHDSNGQSRFVPPDDPQFEAALEGVRDLQLLGFIFDELPKGYLPDDFRARLKRLVKDAVLPQDDAANTFGRDMQCELYAAAICAKAGLKPVFVEPPDIRCDFSEGYAVAVKRIKSYENFAKRIKDGAEQVQRSKLSGCIAADISVVLNSDNERIVQLITDDQLRLVARMAMRKFNDDHFEKLHEWTRGSGVQGIIFFDHHVRQSPERQGWELVTFTTGVNLAIHNERRFKQFNRFFAKFQTGSATTALPLQFV